jgi:hypothetical protein
MPLASRVTYVGLGALGVISIVVSEVSRRLTSLVDLSRIGEIFWRPALRLRRGSSPSALRGGVVQMSKAEDGATFETDLKETGSGWEASYRVISANLEPVKPRLKVFRAKADAVARLSAEATAKGFGL